MLLRLEQEDIEILVDLIAQRVYQKVEKLVSQNNVDSYLTATEAARYLKTKRSHLYSLVHQEKIPHMKVGAKLRFAKKQLDSWAKRYK